MSSINQRLPRPGAAWALPALVLSALVLSAVHGQGPGAPAERVFVRNRSFDMPFNLAPADLANVRELKLYIRPEQASEWKLHATASPGRTQYDPRSRMQIGRFDIHVDDDGTYAFAIMTVFNDGRSEPLSVDRLGPEQIRTVDTRPPEITLRPLPATPTADGRVEVGLEWKIHDDNLARNSIRLEGRWWGASAWVNFARNFAPEAEGKQAWTIPARQRMEIRISAADRAGNEATRTLVLGSGVGTMTGAAAVSGEMPAARDPLGRDPAPVQSQPTFRCINTQSVKLQYRVRERPPSGIDHIDLYVTRYGRDWKKLDQSNPLPQADSDTADIEYKATEDGVYGFTMVAVSKAGIESHAPPRANDPPQIWVEVITKKPEGILKSVRLAQPNDGRTLVLEWKAEDKNLQTLPIIFHYAEIDSQNNAGRWKELTPPLPNSGRYVCAAPQLSERSYLFKVSMTVFDKAGNYFTTEFGKPISTDVVRPQVDIIDVKTPRSDPPKEP
jgi:hypothetical protein